MKYELQLKLWHPNERNGKWCRLKGFNTEKAARAYSFRFPTWATRIVLVETI